MTWLWVALAGGLGAGARFLTDGWITARSRWPLPLGTLVVNVIGSGLLGVVLGWAGSHPGTEHAVAVLGVGFLGGFTTFSTAMVELVPMAHKSPLRAAGWAALMLALALGAAAGGFAVGALLP